MGKIRELLKKNKTLLYIYACYINRHNVEMFERITNSREWQKHIFRYDSFGNQNSDKVIYNIDLNCETTGFFALYRYIIDACYVSERFNFIPYVRWYNSYYNNDSEKQENVFEYFFNQPYRLTEKEVKESFSVVSYNTKHSLWLESKNGAESFLSAGYNITDSYLYEAARICKKYMQLKPEVQQLIEKDTSSIFANGKILGVHFRGGAYKVGFNRHPIALDISDYFPAIDECLENGYTNIFLATDDIVAVNLMTQRYGNKVYFYNSLRSDNDIDVMELKSGRDNNGFLLGYEVLRDAITLSRCNGFVCGLSQVSICVRFLNLTTDKKFDYLKIISKGLNSNYDTAKKIKYYKQKTGK